MQANQCHESLDYRLMFGGQSQLVAGNTRVVLSEPASMKPFHRIYRERLVSLILDRRAVAEEFRATQ